MKRRFSFAILALLALGTGLGRSQTQPRDPFLRLLGNGPWWDSLTRDAKENFVDGYKTAMVKVNHTSQSLCMENMKKAKDISESMSLCTLAQFFDFDVDRQKLVSGIDEFYTESLNRRLPIDFAMEYEKDRLKGDTSPNDLQKKLNEWRGIANK